MIETNQDFNVPYYVFKEIAEYIELTNQGHCKTMKWENIKSLLGLAKINNRLSSEQVNFLIEKYNRE
jgi:hypothetical protein